MKSIRKGRARAEIQGRCDGAGSEEIGVEPSDGYGCQRVLLWCLLRPHFFGEASERRPWINKRDAPGRFCPASLLTARVLPLPRQPLRGSYHSDAATPVPGARRLRRVLRFSRREEPIS